MIISAGLKYDEKEEKVDACQAILDMRKESEEIGKEIGKETGELNKARESARNLYNLGIEVEKIAQGVGYDINTVKEWLGLPAD